MPVYAITMGVGTILDFSVEGKESDADFERIEGDMRDLDLTN